LKIFFN